MPIVRVSAARHPTAEQRIALIRRLTEVIVEELGVAPQVVNVLIEDVPPTHWGVAGESLAVKFASLARE